MKDTNPNCCPHGLAAAKKQISLIFLGWLFGLVTIDAVSQQVSVLPQFFANNPIIKRDPTFEKLQNYLGDAADKTPLGLNENLTAKLKVVRQYVESMKLALAIVDDNDKPDDNGKNLLITYRLFDQNEKKIKVLLSDFLNHYEEIANTITKSLIDQALLKFGFSERENTASVQLKKLVLYLILNALTNEQLDLSKFNSVTMELFSSETANNLKPFLYDALSKEITVVTKDAVIKMTIAINGLIENIKAKMIEGIYKIEEIVDKTKEDISQSLVSANTGIAVNNVEGNFGGGLLVTAISGKGKNGNRTKLGFFVSGLGNIGSADTAHIKQPFLGGFQISCQLNDRGQFNFLTSFLINDKSVGGQSVFFEVGGGYQKRTVSDLIWGIAAFYQHINQKVASADPTKTQMFEIKSLLTFGISIRTVSDTSPVIFIGGSVQKDFTPVVQISYPINFTKQ